jgi:probable addiction module antidote protein
MAAFGSRKLREMSRAGLYKALSKDGNPSFETIVKAMRALGVRLVPQLTTSS